MMKKLVVGISMLVAAMTGSAFAADIAAGKTTASTVCVACHGADGNSAIVTYPSLAGQNASYIAKQLADFKSQTRNDPVMFGMVAALSEDDMKNVAAYYASQTPKGGKAAADKVDLGERIYRAGIAKKGVAACTACHGPAGAGISTSGYPAVSGQHSAYVESQLQKFAEGTRSNDPNRMMRDIASRLSKDEMAAVASYMQGLSK
jgi:cytochrome c553